MGRKRGTDYEEIERRIRLEPDGDPARPAGPWTRDKLALLAYYLPAFAKLCTDKAGGWYYIDGFAGNGANRIEGFDLSKGSALIGVTTEPSPTRAVLIEANHQNSAILKRRTRTFESFTTVLAGDCNALLPSQLRRLSNRALPAFCLLDPEGMELNWSTVEACATNRSVSYPYELLIYFPTPGTARSAGVRDAGLVQRNEEALSGLFGNESWKDIAIRQRDGVLKPGEAGRLYVDRYERQLAELGYTTVLKRPALREDGNLVYHLIFASANDAGKSIMTDALTRAYASQLPLPF